MPAATNPSLYPLPIPFDGRGRAAMCAVTVEAPEPDLRGREYMLKREEEHRETREAPSAPFAAVLDPPAPVAEPAPGAQPTRGERLAALAAEDERSPRAPSAPGTPMIVFEKTSLGVPRRSRRAAQHLADDRQGRVGVPRRPVRLGQVDVHQAAAAASCARPRAPCIVGGRSLEKLRRSKVPQLRRNIGCVFQDFKLLPNRNVYQNVAYALEVQGEDAPEDRAQGARDPAARRSRREARPASRTSCRAASSSASRSRARSSTIPRS